MGCKKSFISLFKQRLKDNYLQEWDNSIMNKDTYSSYRLFKTTFESEGYFEFLDYRCFRDNFVKLRIGVLPINGSSFRTTFSHTVNNLCPVCKCIENEQHFIFVCPLYTDIRDKYLSEIQLVRWQRAIFSKNLEISGNNRFFAFFSALDHKDEESGGCTKFPLLAFAQNKMAAKMAAKICYQTLLLNYTTYNYNIGLYCMVLGAKEFVNNV